jgi:hypothetical protein
MDPESEDEMEPKVKYSFIVQEEDYESETDVQPWDPTNSLDEQETDEVIVPWDPDDIFFRIK